MNERLCVFCKHWSFNGGSPGYSELTPGSDATIDCMKSQYGHTRMENLYDEDHFRQLILKAEKCKHYEQVKP